MAEERMGAKLRAIRSERQLSLRDVAQRSLQLAHQWGRRDCRISPSWLARVEREQHELTSPKVAALAAIYELRLEDLLPCGLRNSVSGHPVGIVLKCEPGASSARGLVSDPIGSNESPATRQRAPMLQQTRSHDYLQAKAASGR